MKADNLKAQVAIAVKACREKKAENITVLKLDAQASGFTDYFVICSGGNARQVEAIAEEVDQKLSKAGFEPAHTEGWNQAEWVLLDYVDFVVHVFSENARKFYDLERLWKTAKRVEPAELEKPERKTAAKKAAPAKKRVSAKKTAAKSGTRAAAKAASSRKTASRSRKSK